MHHQHRYRNLLEVGHEVRLREGHDAVVVGFDASHHSLAPPILNHSLRDFRTGAVEAIKGPRRQIKIELRAVVRDLRLKTVEYFLGQTSWISCSLDHDWRHRANQYGLGNSTRAVTRDVASHLATSGRVPYMHRI